MTRFLKEILENYPLPTSYIFDVNHDCNFNCIMCVKRTMKNPKGQRKFEHFKVLVDKLPWAREISIGALGDPFEIEDIQIMFEYLVSNKIRTSFTTNAQNLTEENIQMIPYQSTVYVSLDGGIPSVFRHYRPGQDLVTLQNNVMKLRQNRQDITVVINHLLMRNNVFYLKEMIKWCADAKVSLTLFYPIFFDESIEKAENVHRIGSDLLGFLIREAREYANMLGVPINTPTSKRVQRGCFRAFNQPIIAYDGTVYACDYSYQNIEKCAEWKSYFIDGVQIVPQQEYAMGNLYKEEFLDIWNSSKWRELRAKLTALMNNIGFSGYENSTLFDYCKNCLVRWNETL